MVHLHGWRRQLALLLHPLHDLLPSFVEGSQPGFFFLLLLNLKPLKFLDLLHLSLLLLSNFPLLELLLLQLDLAHDVVDFLRVSRLLLRAVSGPVLISRL